MKILCPSPFRLAFFIISIGSNLIAQSETNYEFSSLMEEGIKKGYPGLIVGIQEKSESIHIEAIGYSKLESKTKMTKNETFHLASITKLFTAVATLQLIDQKKLSLNDRVIDYLTHDAVTSIPNIESITISQLLDHSSGIYSFNNDIKYIETLLGSSVSDNVRWTPEDLLMLVSSSEAAPQGDPGSGHYYSDANYVLLGLIIEKVSLKSLRSYIKDSLLEPLQMNNTGFFDSSTDRLKITIKPSVNGYLKRSEIIDGFIKLDSSFKEVKPGLLNTTVAGERIDASAGMVSTVEDLITFGKALYKEQLLSSESLAWLLSIGDGIEHDPLNTVRQGIVTVRNTSIGVLFTSLGDGGGGMNTLLAYHPDSDIIVAAFTNVFGNFDEHDFFINDLIPGIVNSKE